MKKALLIIGVVLIVLIALPDSGPSSTRTAGTAGKFSEPDPTPCAKFIRRYDNGLDNVQSWSGRVINNRAEFSDVKFNGISGTVTCYFVINDPSQMAGVVWRGAGEEIWLKE